MALLTIAEATKQYNNPLVDGVAATIVEQNPFMGALPWAPIAGDTLRFTWENTMGGANFVAVNAAIPSTAKDASVVDNKYVSLVTAVGQAEIDRLLMKTANAAGYDPMAYELSSKAKNLGLQYSNCLAKGTVTGGINALASQAGISSDHGGGALDLASLDAVCNLVQGPVDFIVMSRADATKYKQLLRTQGGANEQVIIKDPYSGSERAILAFEGIPIFINDALAKDEDADGGLRNDGTPAVGALSSLYAGRFDDGSRKTGVSMLHPAGTPAGLEVEDIGAMEAKVANAKRIVQHLNFVNFAKHGLVRLFNVA